LARLSLTSNQVDEFEIRATVLNDTFESEDFPASRSAQFVLHCPNCHAETFLGDKFCQECGGLQPAFEEKPRFSSDSLFQMVAHKSKFLYFTVGVLSASFLVLACAFLFAKVPDDLQNALSENKLNDAVAVAEKLMVSRLGSLQGSDAEIYSDAFFRRAQVFADNKNYKLALIDLSKVLPTYSKQAQVAELRRSCVVRAWQVHAEEAKGIGFAPKMQESKRAVSRVPARAKETNSKAQAAVPNPKKSTEIEFDSTSNVSASPSEPSSELDSEEAEMAAYNRHLADYFSRRESKSSKVSAIKEPPSFSEWVQSGKSEF
jgi:hypothetical protein